MNSFSAKLAKRLRLSTTANLTSSLGNVALGVQGSSKLFYSTRLFDSDNDSGVSSELFNSTTLFDRDDDNGVSSKLFNSTRLSDSDKGGNNDDGVEIADDDFLPEKPELQVQGVDPRKGWNYRGVHKAIICGKIGQSPVQKILRNGRTVTIFTVGTGGMFDQRIAGDKNLPKPAQWHRIVVHNETLGAYAVRQFVKNSAVYVEGDIETRVYNDSINGEIKNIPEICVRRDGRIRLVKAGENAKNIPIDELREGLL